MTFYLLDEGGLREGGPDLFYELTGAHFVDAMVFPSDESILYSKEAASGDGYLQRVIEPLYRSFCKKGSKLYLKRGEAIGRHTVHAKESITRGEVVCEYLGKWEPEATQPSSYRWGPIDGRHYRNMGGMIDDGFPNIGAFHLYNVGGVPLRVVFVALDEIPVGEMVTVHYGMNHSVKIFHHQEHQKEKLLLFFKAFSLRGTIKRIKQLQAQDVRSLGFRRLLELESLTAKLRYLYQTPSTLAELLLLGVLDPNEVFALLKEAEVRYFLLRFSLNPRGREGELISALRALEAYFSRDVRDDQGALELIGKVRSRIFFFHFLEWLAKGELRSEALKEASLLDEAHDFLVRGERDELELKLMQTAKRQEFLLYLLQAAKELNSPFVAWLQCLTDPLLPLSPTG